RIIVTVDPHDETSTENPFCHVAYEHPSGEKTKLFDVSDCIGDIAGVNMIGQSGLVGDVSFPVRDAKGDEGYLFQIASARGGNAVATHDYFAAVVHGDAVWATTNSFATGELTIATRPPEGGVVVEDPATTTSTGMRAAIAFGGVRITTLPMLPSHVV